MRLEDLVGVIRTAADDDPELVAATQLRVRRSLEARARGRHRLVGILTTLAILFVGTVSWALATGHVAALWTPVERPPTASPPVASPPPPRHSQAMVAPATVSVPEAVPPAAPAVPADPLAPPRVVRRAAEPAPMVESLYRAAHDLHFHGGDPAAALAAWDAYLAAEPVGRFAVEARYNRGILLARLGRYAEARAALEPFARGDVEPAGYRQTEAAQVVGRLAHYP